MLSGRLVQLIQENSGRITDDVITAIRANPELPNLAGRPDADLREWCQEILENLDYLLTARKDQEVSRRYEILGRLRFEESIPLHEAVRRSHILKDKIVGFIRQQGFALTAVQLYAEQELEHRISTFFDDLVYHLVKGYESAIKQAAQLARGR